MNIRRFLVIASCLAACTPPVAAAETPKKPAPSLTVKDLALREAKTCDANHNGKIDAQEMSQVRVAQTKNPKSYLYLFDDNGNKYLDDSELSKIRLGPASAKPAPAHAGQAKKKKK